MVKTKRGENLVSSLLRIWSEKKNSQSLSHIVAYYRDNHVYITNFCYVDITFNILYYKCMTVRFRYKVKRIHLNVSERPLKWQKQDNECVADSPLIAIFVVVYTALASRHTEGTLVNTGWPTGRKWCVK